ncbi:MAG: YafY family protein [Longicatena sp.]
MQKSTRLNDMMIFLNNRTYFNLIDIMQEYGISKSTALRDIQALEEIGMPIYSEYGRNGRYGILKNRLLSPIIFTVDEMYALYFAMLTLNAYESTPFHLSVEKLKDKFETCLSNELISKIHKMESVFEFKGTKHYNSSPFLKEILQAILENTVCSVTYHKEDKKKLYHIQFINISSSFGQWYVTGFNFDTQRTHVLRCDKIVNILKSNAFHAKPIDELLNSSTIIFRAQNAIDFEVSISPKGVDLFHKENYPSMKLQCTNGQYIIKGYYNKGEELFIADYFISYGKFIKSIRPIQLKELLQDRICELLKHYQNI